MNLFFFSHCYTLNCVAAFYVFYRFVLSIFFNFIYEKLIRIFILTNVNFCNHTDMKTHLNLFTLETNCYTIKIYFKWLAFNVFTNRQLLVHLAKTHMKDKLCARWNIVFRLLFVCGKLIARLLIILTSLALDEENLFLFSILLC